MYEDMIAALLDDMGTNLPAGARVAALRGQPPPMPPPGPPPAPMGPDPGQGLLPPPPMPLQTPMPIPDVPMGPPGPVPGPQATQPLPGPGSPSQRPPGPSGGPMLPQALGVGPPPAPPAPIPEVPDAPDPLEQRQVELMRQYEQAMQPADRAPMEAAYQKRAREGPRMLLHALAAEHVGKQGLAKHYYGQAGEMGDPMKMAGGTMTPTGFIEDPGYAREFEIKKIEARMAQNDRIIQSNAVRADKEKARKENEEFKQRMFTQADETKRLIGGWAHGDRQARLEASGAKAGAGKILPTKAVNDLTELQGKAETMGTLAREFKDEYAGVGGTGMTLLGKVPFVSTEAAQFWKNYKKESELIERHALFGAALTAQEQSQWRSADISSTMDPKDVRANLERRRVLAEKVLAKSVSNLRGSGYNTEAFDPLDTAPAAPPGPAGPAASKAQAGPVRVSTPAEAAKLAPGTRFITPDGQTRVRQ